MSVTVYSQPACGGCIATYRSLNKKGIEHDSVDVTQDAKAHEFITAQLGYQAAPVVVLRDDAGNVLDSWSGFREDKIKELV